ncbi:MAG: hypothetical protein R6U86_00845 [Bacteroidales bacterium]
MRKRWIIFRVVLLSGLAGALFTGFAAERNDRQTAGECVFVHTDRDIYVAGEEVFFSLWLFTPQAGNEPASRFAYIGLRGASGMIERISMELSDAKGSGAIYLPDTMSTGYYELIAFTNWMRNVGERGYFRKSILVVNRFDRELANILPEQGQENPAIQSAEAVHFSGLQPTAAPGPLKLSIKEQFEKQELMTIKAEAPDPADPITHMEVSVSLLASLESPFSGLGLSTCLATNSVTERLSDRESMRDKDEMARPSDDWYPKEHSHKTIRGRATHTWSGDGLQGLRILLSTPDTLVNLIYTETNANGYFFFELSDYYDDKELFLTPDLSTTNSPVSLGIEDRFSIKTPFQSTPFADMPARVDHIRNCQDIVRINKVFDIRSPGPQSIDAPGSPAPRPFAEAVLTIYPENYAPMTDLREISRELVGPWRIRRSGGQYTQGMICNTSGSLLPGEPVLFIDGIITTNLHALLAIGGAQIRKLEVHNLNWVYGDMYFPGIVAVFTKDEAYLDMDFIPEPLRLIHPAHHRPLAFYSPGPEAGAGRKDPARPDLRQLLYWNTDAAGDEPLSWYASDLAGEYRVFVRAQTQSGQLLEATKTIVVK